MPTYSDFGKLLRDKVLRTELAGELDNTTVTVSFDYYRYEDYATLSGTVKDGFTYGKEKWFPGEYFTVDIYESEF